MKRRLLNFVTALSLLLCVAVCVLWVRSYWTMDIVHLRTHDRFYFVSTYRGTLWAGAWLRSEHDPETLNSGHQVYAASMYDAIWRKYRQADHRHVLGFHYLSPPPGGLVSARVLVIPAACPLALAAGIPAAWLVSRLRRGRRRRAGLCAACGYDLRATPACCPECGKAPSVSPGR